MKYLVLISYKGTDYHGWQVQPNGITVQAVMSRAAKTAFGCKCAVTGCSRTDSGVHAKKYYCTVEPLSDRYNKIPADRLPDALNAVLPSDVSASEAKTVDDSFHPRYSAKEKEYVYLILNRRRPDPFMTGLSYHLPFPVLDIGLMRLAAEHFIGKHDFSGFMSSGSSVEDTVRTVTSLSADENDGLVSITVSADGFLYNMVRIISGTLVEAGLRRISPDDVPGIIDSRDRRKAGPTLPACGLYLNNVKY